MNDKEMIEQMAKYMCSSYESEKGCKTCPTNWCYAEECATMAYYNSCRDVKDKVVLTREEFELLTDIKDLQQQVQDSLSNMSEDFEQIEKQARKETAREVLSEMLLIKGVDGWQENEQLVEFGNKLVNKIEELAKRYEVDLGE